MNQFEVSARLDGLEEKFSILDQDPVAEALHDRRDVLKGLEWKWEPEVLLLLLELSQAPLTTANLYKYERLFETKHVTAPPLQWADLVSDDPLLRDRQVWENVDFAESSDDETRENSTDPQSSDSDDDLTLESLPQDPYEATSDLAKHVADHPRVKHVVDAQFWRNTPNVNGIQLETVKSPITELQILRETIFMLAGLPTSVYQADQLNGQITVSGRYAIRHMHPLQTEKLLLTFARQGAEVLHLRTWLRGKSTNLILDRFRSCLQGVVRTFDQGLNEEEACLVRHTSDITISLVRFQTEIEDLLRPLKALTNIVRSLESDDPKHALTLLELLYDSSCASHLTGDQQMFQCLGSIFFRCFEIYLQYIRCWMDSGDLTGSENIFFVMEVDANAKPADIWHSRYSLSRKSNGELHAPQFLHTSSQKIFTTGKSLIVLKRLRQHTLLRKIRLAEPSFDFETVCSQNISNLTPFPELFDAALNIWIESKHSTVSATLQSVLFRACGVLDSIDALAAIYLHADGYAAEVLTESVSEKLDNLDESWHDQFTLNEMLQSAYGVHSPAYLSDVRVRITEIHGMDLKAVSARGDLRCMEVLQFEYRLSWPVQIIISPTSMKTYQKMCTFLFQLRRSLRLTTQGQSRAADMQGNRVYFSVRNSFRWFIAVILNHLTIHVIKPNLCQLRQQLREAADVDEMIDIHSQFLHRTQSQCMLDNKLSVVHKTIIKILNTAVWLHDHHRRERRQAEIHDRKSMTLKSGTSTTNTSRLLPVDHDSELSVISRDFHRDVRFIIGALSGVARAGVVSQKSESTMKSQEPRLQWATLATALEAGLDHNNMDFV